MANNNNYKIVSDSGKGIATGDAAVSNDKKIETDADFRTSELDRANKVIKDRQLAGLDTSAQEDYINQINKYNANTTIPPVKQPSNVDPKAELARLIVQNQQNQTKALTDASDANLKTQQGNIGKAYNANVAEQEGFKTDVSDQFSANVEDVNQRRYQENEAGRVSAEQRGIGSSAQFQALNRGTMSRASKLKLQAAETRDKAINDISSRIAQLKLGKDIDLSNAQAQRDLAVASGTAQIGSEAFGQQFGLANDEIARDYQTSEREAGQDFNAEQAGISREFQSYMQDKGFNHDITMFDKNSDMQKYMQASSQAFQLSQYDKQRADRKSDEAYEYALQLSRNIDKVTPGTPEYEAMKGVMDMESENLREKMELDWEYQQKALNYNTVLEENSYQEDLNRNLNAFTEGTAEYALQERSNDYQLEQWKDKTRFEVEATYLADAINDQVQAGIGENYPSFFAQFKNNLTSNIIAKLTPGEEFDALTLDKARDAGLILPTKEWYDNKAYYDNLYDMGIIDKNTRDTLNK